MPDSYRTIEHASEGLYREKGSRFIGLAFPVVSVEEVTQCLGKVRKKYHDARHHCYAYRLGTEGLLVRSHDDGEPVHSAGPPILGQIRALNLTNVLVIVVRYFGGTLLGTGGLTQAYKTAAREALHHARVVERTLEITIGITFDYVDLGRVMKLAGEEGNHWRKQHFGERCSLEISARAGSMERLLNRLKAIPSVRVDHGSQAGR